MDSQRDIRQLEIYADFELWAFG